VAVLTPYHLPSRRRASFLCVACDLPGRIKGEKGDAGSITAMTLQDRLRGFSWVGCFEGASVRVCDAASPLRFLAAAHGQKTIGKPDDQHRVRDQPD
jgi:hypothetical protein